MTLTEFLQARIAEDEAAVVGLMSGDGDPEFFWGPDRIRAECEAKRRIVERCSAVGALMPSEHLAQGVLSLLALPYADHPGWREEWRV